MSVGQKIIDALSDRKGFDWWWDDLDPDIQAEIVAELDHLIDQHNGGVA